MYFLMLIVEALIINISTFFVYASQALKHFRLLATTNAIRGLLFFVLIIVLIALGCVDYRSMIGAYLVSYLLFMVYLAFRFRSFFSGNMPPVSALVSCAKNNIGIGFFIMIGNFISLFLLSIDRVIISSFLPLEQFSQYAFALSIVALAQIFIKAASEVFFPHLSLALPELRTKVFRLGTTAIIFLWATFFIIYFPLAWLIEIYLPQYAASLLVMKLLLGTVGLVSLIQILHVNFYRIYRKQHQYFLYSIAALAVTISLVFLALKFIYTLESVAIAMVVSSCIWYVVNELILKPITSQQNRDLWKRMIIMVCYFAAFLCASILTNWFVTQMLIYVCFFLLLTSLALRSEMIELMILIREQIKAR
jgi:O-antigen/teichoic acid export membrane protein